MNILTFDIEDWWVYDHYSLGEKKDFLPRLNYYLEETLSILEERKVQATFFCLGKMAEMYPEIIKKISSKGHQIGCHSYSHMFFGNHSWQEISEDTYKAMNIIENITGEKVIAYRAPAFSIMEKNKWVFEILAQNGILYDCSVFPANRSYGGFPGFNSKVPAIINYNGISIKEFPVSTTKIFGKEIAYSGGGYFRLFPYWLIKKIVKENDYTMTYFHIKDFDKDQIRTYGSFEGESALSRYFKKYYGLSNSFSKFKMYVSDFEHVSVEQADKIIDWENAQIINI